MKNQSQSVIILYKNRVHLKYDTGIMICIIRTRREKKRRSDKRFGLQDLEDGTASGRY